MRVVYQVVEEVLRGTISRLTSTGEQKIADVIFRLAGGGEVRFVDGTVVAIESLPFPLP